MGEIEKACGWWVRCLGCDAVNEFRETYVEAEDAASAHCVLGHEVVVVSAMVVREKK